MSFRIAGWLRCRTSLAVVLSLSLGAAAQAQSQTTVVAVSGQPIPGGGRFFTAFDSVVLSNSGQAAFHGQTSATVGGIVTGDGMFRGADPASLTSIALSGGAAPDGDGILTDPMGLPAINTAGQVAFRGGYIPNVGFGSYAIYRGTGLPALTQIARTGDPAPGGGFYTDLSQGYPAFNEAGQASFYAQVQQPGLGVIPGVFRGDGTTSVAIAKRGQAPPDGIGTYFLFDILTSMNDLGQVAFEANVNGGPPNTFEVIVRGDGVSSVQIVRQGQTAPGGNGLFSDLIGTSINNVGAVAFKSPLSGTSGGTTDDLGIFRGNGVTPLVQIARKGQLSPDGNGVFSDFEIISPLNDAGQVAIMASLSGTSGGSSDARGLYLGDGATPLLQIARKGQLSPDGNGVFNDFFNFTINELGRGAFQATLSGSSGGASQDRGIFFYDSSLGVVPVARKGASLLGSTITSLGFSNNFGDVNERSGFNALSQIAYTFGLADGRKGVAIWTPVPEPGSVALLSVAGVALACQARRRRSKS